MEAKAETVNYAVKWGDFPLSPKGDEKEVLRTIVLPAIVHRIIAQGKPVRNMLDVGADTGFITGLIRKHTNGQLNPMITTAIEPNYDREGILRAEYNDVFLGSWEEWHASHPDKKFDLIVSSHNLYYFPDPEKTIISMSTHLTQKKTDNRQNGRICLILENFKSGKLNLLQQAAKISPDSFVTPRGNVSIINPAKLIEQLSKKFVVESFNIPINVKFNTSNEAVERFKELFADNPITSEQVHDYVEKKLIKSSNNTFTWRRDSIAIVIKKE